MSGQKRGLREMSQRDEEERMNRLREEKEKQHQTRLGYQDLSAKLRATQNADVMGFDENTFATILAAADKLSSRAGRPREQLQDADILGALSHNLKVETRKLQQHDGRSPDDFVTALIRKFGRGGVEGGGEDGEPSEHSFDWARMGREHAVKFMRPAVTFGTMLGPLSAEAPKGRAIGQRRKRDEVAGAIVTPAEADAQAAQDDQDRERETDVRARSLFKAIRKAKPGSGGVPVLPLVLDSESFTRSVENIFALSFLVSNGRCKLNAVPLEDGANPLAGIRAEPMTAPTDEDRARGLYENSQFILRLDYSDWEELKGFL